VSPFHKVTRCRILKLKEDTTRNCWIRPASTSTGATEIEGNEE
jgi:hypothetical protein